MTFNRNRRFVAAIVAAACTAVPAAASASAGLPPTYSIQPQTGSSIQPQTGSSVQPQPGSSIQPQTSAPADRQSPAPSDDTRWLPIALSITGALVIVSASATQLRRFRLRRRRAVRSTA